MLVTTTVYVTVSPTLNLSPLAGALAVLSIVMLGFLGSTSITSSPLPITSPLISSTDATATFVISFPKSSSTIVYVKITSPLSPGANVSIVVSPDGTACFISSVTSMLFNTTLPVLVTTTVYVTVSPTLNLSPLAGALAVLSIVILGFLGSTSIVVSPLPITSPLSPSTTALAVLTIVVPKSASVIVYV